jgi:hypothetical protein
MNGLGQGPHQRPLLPRPAMRTYEGLLSTACAAAWEEARSKASRSSPEAEVLRHSCTTAAGAAAAFVTPEGCVLDFAVPGASCGVRIVRAGSDFRPGGSGLRASLLADQCILEAAGWTVEFVLEADIAWLCALNAVDDGGRRAAMIRKRAGHIIQSLLKAEVERRGRQGGWRVNV